jgi:hypothetical protein
VCLALQPNLTCDGPYMCDTIVAERRLQSNLHICPANENLQRRLFHWPHPVLLSKLLVYRGFYFIVITNAYHLEF